MSRFLKNIWHRIFAQNVQDDLSVIEKTFLFVIKNLFIFLKYIFTIVAIYRLSIIRNIFIITLVGQSVLVTNTIFNLL